MIRFLLALSVACFVVGCDTEEDTKKEDKKAAATTPAATNIVAKDDQPTQTKDATPTMVTLAVPKMSCPISCYPKVKETLESQTGVSGVELVKQDKEGAINDRRVVISTSNSFDAEKAIAALADKGFAGSTVEN